MYRHAPNLDPKVTSLINFILSKYKHTAVLLNSHNFVHNFLGLKIHTDFHYTAVKMVLNFILGDIKNVKFDFENPGGTLKSAMPLCCIVSSETGKKKL